MENTYSIKTTKWTGNSADAAAISVLSDDCRWQFSVTPTEIGTEKQIEYANSIKADAIRTIDKKTALMISSGRYQADMVIALRNRTMDAVDADVDAAHVIDALKTISRDFQSIVLAYNVKIA